MGRLTRPVRHYRLIDDCTFYTDRGQTLQKVQNGYFGLKLSSIATRKYPTPHSSLVLIHHPYCFAYSSLLLDSINPEVDAFDNDFISPVKCDQATVKDRINQL